MRSNAVRPRSRPRAVDRSYHSLAHSFQMEDHHVSVHVSGKRKNLELGARLLREVGELIARHAGATETRTPLANIVLSASKLPTPPADYMAEPAFALVAQGAKHVVLGHQVFDYAAGQYLIYSVDLPLSAHIVQATATEPFLDLGRTLKPDASASR